VGEITRRFRCSIVVDLTSVVAEDEGRDNNLRSIPDVWYLKFQTIK
jgi:hypothetical protein